MIRFYILVFSILIFKVTIGQTVVQKSIHQEQYEYYSQLGYISLEQYDSINDFALNIPEKGKQILNKRVFGYHPYWGGSNYLNYQWDLLTDFCHFSYEVNPANGLPLTTHEWNTSTAIDSALANGVNVHLCVTLFSSHSTFFNSTSAKQNLIENIIELIESRGAQGVNIDVEALPSSLGDEYTSFMIDLAEQFHNALPDAEVSMAIPAVDWSATTDFVLLKNHVDFFMVMAYDYYWNGSSQAGPVGGLYTMNPGYDYNVSRTISYYQSLGIENNQLLIGMPYYGREWETEGQYAPSNVTAYGDAKTYANIQNNPLGYYEPENRHIDFNSMAIYYAYETGGWNQCFIDEPYSLGRKYDIINRRDLGGIGIWALGYDNGYDDLWNVISDKFSDQSEIVLSDTIFDSGGPGLNYYNEEYYLYKLAAPVNHKIELTFNFLDLESGYDSLWIFDGPDNSFPMIGAFSGNLTPPDIISNSAFLTLEFYSDIATVGEGWEAIYEITPITGINPSSSQPYGDIYVFPNPVVDELTVSCSLKDAAIIEIGLYDINGKKHYSQEIGNIPNSNYSFSFPAHIIRRLPKAAYIVYLKSGDFYMACKIIKE